MELVQKTHLQFKTLNLLGKFIDFQLKSIFSGGLFKRYALKKNIFECERRSYMKGLLRIFRKQCL